MPLKLSLKPSPLFLFALLCIWNGNLWALQAEFSANRTQGCVPLQVNFSNLSTGSPTAFLWDFGNSNTSTFPTPTATYVVPGTYTVSLTVSNGSGSNTKTKSAYITVYPLPVVNFDATIKQGCNPLVTQFRDSSVSSGGAISSWSWDFGNGNISSQRNPINTYNLPGNYNASLMVTDVNGCSNTRVKANYIQVTQTPTADFSVHPSMGCNLPHQATFYPSLNPQGAYQYEWDFGHGPLGYGVNITKSYPVEGAFTVRLKVITPQCTVNVVKPNAVFIRSVNPDFALAPQADLCAPGNVQILNTTANDTLVYNYEWRLNGVLVGSVKNLSLNNLNAGTYEVSLTIKFGNCNATTTKAAFFTVLPGAKAGFSANRTQFCKVPSTVEFYDSSTQAASLLWRFGNGQTSTLKNTQHTYTQFGKYNVTQVAIHSNGCRDSVIRPSYIRIDTAFLDIYADSNQGCAPLQAKFRVIDTNMVKFNQYNWTFGSGLAAATDSSPTRTFTNEGTYLVTLQATNAEGCIAIATDTIKVGIPINGDFVFPKQKYCRNELPPNPIITLNPQKPGTSFSWFIADTPMKKIDSLSNLSDTGWVNLGLTITYNGCESKVIKPRVIRIDGPRANFEVSNDGCSKSKITFTNLSRRPYTHFVWDFGNGKKDSTNLSPIHFYDSAGNYVARLTLYDSTSGCSSTVTKVVTVVSDFFPSFTIQKKEGCAPFSTQLINTSVPLSDVDQCSFSMGPKIVTGNTVSMLIGSPGRFTVTMTVIDKKGCIHTLTKVDSILGIGAQVLPVISPMFTCAPVLVTVKDSSKSDYPIARRVWYWGNGDSTVYTNKDSIFSRKFYSSGPTVQSDGYIIRLVLTDTAGCRHLTTRKIFLTRPKARFTTQQKKTCYADSFVFTTPPVDSIGLSPLVYSWNTLGFEQKTKNATVVIAGDTILPVVLKITDAYGCADSIVEMVRVVTGPPKPNFDANPKVINCPGPPVYFVNLTQPGSSPITSYEWEFGDGGKSPLKEPARIYLLPGSYSVKLTVKDSLGCEGVKTIPDLVLIGGPKANYTLTPKSGCAPLNVSFVAQSSDPVRFEWDLADGSFDTAANLSHVYARAGIYVPNLSIIDSSGCKVGLPPKDTLHVFANPEVNVLVSQKKNCLGNEVKVFSLVQPDTAISSYLWNIDGQAYTEKGPITYLCQRLGNIPLSLVAIDHKGCKGEFIDLVAMIVFKDSIAPAKPMAYWASVLGDESVTFDLASSTAEDLFYYEVGHDFVGSLPTQWRKVSQVNDTFQVFDQLATLNNNYSYTLRAIDVCKNVSEPSTVHTTVELKALGIVNAVKLNWTPYKGWDTVLNYRVYRYHELNKRFEPIARVGGQEHGYIDSNITCHKLFRYQVRAEYGKLISFSDTAAAVPLFESTAPTTRAIRATVVNNKFIRVEWAKQKHRYAFQYLIKRVSADPIRGNKEFLLSWRDTFIEDKDVDIQRYEYTYTVQIKDECGGVSGPSNKARNILLNLAVKKNDKLTEDPVLTWKNYQEWNSGVDNYKVFFYNEAMGGEELIAQKSQSDTLSVKHNYIDFDQDDYCYFVMAYQQDSNWIESRSNTTCMETEPRLYAPNAFTCDGDGLNDGFLVKGVFIKQFELHIYNRWGEEVFYTTDINKAWDGKYQGVEAKSDVYVFVAKGWGRKEKFTSLKGNVTLLR